MRRAEIRPRVAALVAAGLVALTAGCSASAADDATFSGTVLDNPYQVDGAAMTDTDGDSYSLTTSTDQRLTLVFFGYTNCPDICPMVLGNLASAMTRLDAADRDQLDVVFVSTDPSRDDEQTIRTYLDRIDPSFIGLSAPIDTVIDVGRSIALYVSDGTKLPSGGYDLGGHSSSVVAIDPSDQAPVLWSQDTTPAEFADDIHALLQDT